ncbi:unnamed protein product [Thelazia callipaeda]|uniref:dolichol kinase n=1 Tax=Thelazia callipaeda TaxID=103827 RepID=A0A0N5DB73_THECL|nr:unnamed protein product [Thelazia callipaeda]
MMAIWKQQNADRTLVEIAVVATILFTILATKLKQNVLYANLSFVIIVLCSLHIYAIRLHVYCWQLFPLLYRRVFDGTDERFDLLLFYIICVVESLIFCIVVNLSSHSSTIHRKFFHLTASLVCIAGIKYDFELIWLLAWLMLCLFIVIEVFRSNRIQPWSSFLSNWLMVFVNEQDSCELILTPIYLLAGIFLPIFLSPISNQDYPRLYHFAGVATVGVGDSFAAIFGSLYGRLKWPKSRKTVEGSIAFAVSQYIFTVLICQYYINYDVGVYELSRLFLSSILCAFVEAQLPAIDNLILPLMAYLTMI